VQVVDGCLSVLGVPPADRVGQLYSLAVLKHNTLTVCAKNASDWRLDPKALQSTFHREPLVIVPLASGDEGQLTRSRDLQSAVFPQSSVMRAMMMMKFLPTLLARRRATAPRIMLLVGLLRCKPLC